LRAFGNFLQNHPSIDQSTQQTFRMTRDVIKASPLLEDVTKRDDEPSKVLPPSKPPGSLMQLHAMGSFQALFQTQEIDVLEASSSSSTSTSNLRKRNSSNALQLLDDVESRKLPSDTSEHKDPLNHPSTITGPIPSQEEEKKPIKTQMILGSKSEGKKSRPNSPQRNVTSSKDHSEKKGPAKAPTASSNIIHHPNSLITQPPPLLLLPSPDSGNHMDPDEFLLQLVTALYPHVKLQVKPALELSTSSSYFPIITEEQMARYNTHVVALVRTNNVAALQEYHATHGPNALDCCNRFGEGLLNMACRRGFTEMVSFLLSASIDLPVRVRDDFGRTPLHDACWHPEPQLDICRWIMQKDPSLFLVADKRGYTPFQYARQSDWPIWRRFLVQNLEQIRILGTQPEIIATFSAAASPSGSSGESSHSISRSSK
jgi:Ankyrin repeats (3 copies)